MKALYAASLSVKVLRRDFVNDPEDPATTNTVGAYRVEDFMQKLMQLCDTVLCHDKGGLCHLCLVITAA